MTEVNVIVVPEKREYIHDTTYLNEIYVNKKLGKPNLKGNNAKYIAPFWLDEDEQGVNRIYHILDDEPREEKDAYVIPLGNSFVLEKKWNSMGNHRKFEYHSLNKFGFAEIKDGLLLKL